MVDLESRCPPSSARGVIDRREERSPLPATLVESGRPTTPSSASIGVMTRRSTDGLSSMLLRIVGHRAPLVGNVQELTLDIGIAGLCGQPFAFVGLGPILF